MIVLDNFRIDPPYENVLSIATSGEDAGLERVIKVVSESFYALLSKNVLCSDFF